MRVAISIGVVAIVLVGVIAWALAQGENFDPLGARAELLDDKVVVVEGASGTSRFRWVFEPDGARALLVRGDDGTVMALGEDDDQRVRLVASQCVIAVDELGLPLGALPVPRELPDDARFDEEQEAVEYDVPGRGSGTLTEDLGALRDGVIRYEEAGTAMRVREATGAEREAVDALFDTAPAPTAEVVLRFRRIDAGPDVREGTWHAVEGCGDVLAAEVFDDIALAGDPSVAPAVAGAITLDVPIDGGQAALAEAAAGRMAEEVALEPGARFAAPTASGAYLFAYEVVSCEATSWFACGEGG